MLKPKTGNRIIILVLTGIILAGLLGACGDITNLPLSGSPTSAGTTSSTTFAPLTATPVPAQTTVASTPGLTITPTTISPTIGVATNNLTSTVSTGNGTTTPLLNELMEPLPTPFFEPVDRVTPITLGASETALKATGFNGISAKAFLDDLITEVGKRLVSTAGELKTVEWLEKKFRSFGYNQITRQDFNGPVPPLYLENARFELGRTPPSNPGTPFLVNGTNLIVTRPATKPDAKILILGGHHDTVKNTVGANDNGSGIAVLLEIARIFTNRYPDYELRFIAFGGEEVGMIGSTYYVKSLSNQERSRIIAYLNLDAVAVGQSLVVIGTPELVVQIATLLSKIGIRLEGRSQKPFGSDVDSFTEAGIKTLDLLRWRDFNGHLPSDTADRVFAENLLMSGGVAILIAEYLLKGSGS